MGYQHWMWNIRFNLLACWLHIHDSFDWTANWMCVPLSSQHCMLIKDSEGVSEKMVYIIKPVDYQYSPTVWFQANHNKNSATLCVYFILKSLHILHMVLKMQWWTKRKAQRLTLRLTYGFQNMEVVQFVFEVRQDCGERLPVQALNFIWIMDVFRQCHPTHIRTVWWDLKVTKC